MITAAATAAAVAIGGWAAGGPPHRSRPAVAAQNVRPRAAPARGPVLAGAATTLVTWPVGYPVFGPASGPPAYVADLGTGRISERQIPGIVGCDCQPYLARAGGRLVYVGTGGITAIAADLSGRPQVLGLTQFFAPSAARGRIWLVHFGGGYLGPPVRVQSVPVAGGRPGRVRWLPPGAVNLVRGTDAGLLLDLQRGRSDRLALWQLGAPPAPLPYSPGPRDGFDATPRRVAYGTGCRLHLTAARAPQAGTAYQACPVLRVFDVVTGRLASFAAPRGTAGWVPAGLNLVSAFSARGEMIAVYAAERPAGKDRARLYLIRLAAGGRPELVPASAASLFAVTAWSVRRSWLLYQGPGGRLRAYQPASGRGRVLTAPCCQYTAMIAAPARSG